VAFRIFKRLSELLDVDTSGVSDGDALVYDDASDTWIPGAGGGGGGAPTDATYITQTANGTLSAEQALASLSTGLVKVTTGTGVLSTATGGTDYANASHAHAGEDITSGTVADARIASTIARDSEVTSAISTSEAGQVRDGDAAGGVLGGTYPNPSFAADMATQAELDAHINDSSDAHDASAISIADAGNDFTATDVEGALAELQSDHETDAQNLADHIADSSAAHAASAISADSTTLVGTGTDVQAVLEELDNGIADHIADSSDAHDASAISVADSAGIVTATDVEAAIAELMQRGRQLSYVEHTSSVNLTATTEAGANTIVTAAACVLDGSTVVEVEYFCAAFASPGGGANRFAIANLFDAVDGGAAASLGFMADVFSSASSQVVVPCLVRRRLTPASGSHVFSIRGHVTAGTGVANAGAGGAGNFMPGYIRVTRL
jgi:hypothetical protein